MSGLTDVDAISLTSLQLHRGGELTGTQLARVIALAYAANLLFKLGMVQAIAGRGAAWPVARGFSASLAVLALALLLASS